MNKQDKQKSLLAHTEAMKDILTDEEDSMIADLIDKVHNIIDNFYSEDIKMHGPEDQKSVDTENKVPEAEVLNGYPAQYLGIVETSDEYDAHIQRQAERLNKVMGISIEDSLDQLKTATMRAVVGVVHQVIQAKAKCSDLNIDEFFNDNLYGNKLFPADIKDGLVYSDIQNLPCNYRVTA